MRRRLAGLVQDDKAEPVDEAAGLGGGDEDIRRHEAVSRPLPAGKRFHPGDAARGGADDRLVDHRYLVIQNGMAQIRLKLQLFFAQRIHFSS